MSERWYVFEPFEDRMAAICEDSEAQSGALAYVGRKGRDKTADARLIASAPTMHEYIREQADKGDRRAAEILRSINASA